MSKDRKKPKPERIVGKVTIEVIEQDGYFLREHVGDGQYGDDKFSLSRDIAGRPAFWIEGFRGKCYRVSLPIEEVCRVILESKP